MDMVREEAAREAMAARGRRGASEFYVQDVVAALVRAHVVVVARAA
jgi:hypothetical protein